MDNHFLAKDFDWGGRPLSRKARLLNQLLDRLGTGLALRRRAATDADMTNLEQRLNLWHLAQRPLCANIPGDFVEVGSFDGKTATIFGRVLAGVEARTLHVYDHFKAGFHLDGRDIQEELLRNFAEAGCPAPTIHNGDFFETLPDALPQAVAFAHIDCGINDDVALHRRTVEHALRSVYPRLSTGAVCVLMDYFDAGVCEGENINPGAGRATDAFLADKPERMCSLYAGDYCHGYFVKL